MSRGASGKAYCVFEKVRLIATCVRCILWLVGDVGRKTGMALDTDGFNRM